MTTTVTDELYRGILKYQNGGTKVQRLNARRVTQSTGPLKVSPIKQNLRILRKDTPLKQCWHPSIRRLEGSAVANFRKRRDWNPSFFCLDV